MSTQMNVSEAKARLSELVSAAEQGADVVIARAGKPVVRLVPIEAPAKRQLGFLSVDIPDDFFDVLGDSELAEWE
jgi:prevent-host-death family protein